MGAYVARRTISFHSNPGGFGTANTQLAHINILCNPPLYEQPGFTLLDPVYNHNYAGMLCASLSAGTECFDNDFPNVNLNHYDNFNIPCGTYKLYAGQCFPFYCAYDAKTISSSSSCSSSSSSCSEWMENEKNTKKETVSHSNIRHFEFRQQVSNT